MAARILLVGFERFGELDTNPSEIIIRNIEERTRSGRRTNITTRVLKTEFISAGNEIKELISHLKPEVVLCVGVSAGAENIRLERVALNLDDADVPDNAGLKLVGQPITPGGPAAFWSTLPLERMRSALNGLGIPVVISNHAGTYVCNHVFYIAREEIDKLGIGTECGLMHVPLASDQSVSSAHAGRLPLKMMVQAVDRCLDVLEQDVAETTEG